MSKRNGRQKGAQRHAEGQHGDKAHARFIESLHEGRPPAERKVATRRGAGARRLNEDRQQHDDADKNSEKNRLNRERKRGRLDQDSPQVRGALKGSPPAGK
jgi:hypothetical protein